MRHSLLLVAALLAAGVFALAISHTAEERRLPPVQTPANNPPAPGQLPKPLRPLPPEVAEMPNNPCSKLVIPEDVQHKAAALKEPQRRAQESATRLTAKYPLPAEIQRGNPERKAVALTIDTGTGGSQGITELLAIAQHYHIPLTFFVTGCWAVENPELLQRIVLQGHSIANHTLTHINLAEVSDENAKREITETDRLIRKTTGITPVIFRKPLYAGGQRITDIAGKLRKISVLGYPDFGDTTGWRKGVNANDVRNLVERKTAPGAIWVFHNLSLADLGAFEDVVRFHLQEGYAVVSVEDLLAPSGQ